ncbi:hypothetical protein, partial [Bordetella petrii]|uniref:hypothetical protein n=1 Tax=Bordetella petrii TaxID=94624 RepID=UPI001E4BE79D
MFSSPGFSSPRGPFAGAAPLAHRPLSAIAATTAGGVPQTRIQRIIVELIPVLEKLHQEGRVCGDISVHSVGMDETGRAHLMALSGYARPVDAQALTPGYAPFELYTEASEWPRGPWTDIYALSAVVYSLVSGQRPPAAPERRIAESYRPLTELGLNKYDPQFLAAIDAGLALAPADRPQTIRAYAESLALPQASYAASSAPAEDPRMAPMAADEAVGAARPGNLRSVLRVLLLGIATLAVSAYWWGRLTNSPEEVITYSEPASSPPVQQAQSPEQQVQSPQPQPQAQAAAPA